MKENEIQKFVRDLLRQASESEEDAFWSEQAEERMKTFDPKKALTHEEVWRKIKRRHPNSWK